MRVHMVVLVCSKMVSCVEKSSQNKRQVTETHNRHATHTFFGWTVELCCSYCPACKPAHLYIFNYGTFVGVATKITTTIFQNDALSIERKCLEPFSTLGSSLGKCEKILSSVQRSRSMCSWPCSCRYDTQCAKHGIRSVPAANSVATWQNKTLTLKRTEHCTTKARIFLGLKMAA